MRLGDLSFSAGNWERSACLSKGRGVDFLSYEHSTPVPAARAARRASRGRRLPQGDAAIKFAIDASNGGRTAYVRYWSRIRPRGESGDVRRGRETDASHDDTG